ncbi:hypothetical protein ES703_57745 [subsurface metagenome]
MPELPGDQNVAKLFGFPGFEALIRVHLKYVNLLRVNQGDPALTYEEFRAEIEAKMADITNGTP